MRIKNLVSKNESVDIQHGAHDPFPTEESSPVSADSIYEDRIVAFIDILGFRSIVQKSSIHHNSERFHIPQYREEGLSKAIFEALDTKQHAWKQAFFKELDLDSPPHLSLRITSFSDCIALSCEPNEIDFCYLVFCINFIARHMHQNGFMLRGGLCEGELHHSETTMDDCGTPIAGRIFGPAFIKAYDLECKKAGHSRIILSNMLWKTVKENWLNKDDCNYCKYISLFIEQDDDGPIRLDTLMSYYRQISTQGLESISSELVAIKEETEKVLSFYIEDSRIYSKLIKFSKEFNLMLDDLQRHNIVQDSNELDAFRIGVKIDAHARRKVF